MKVSTAITLLEQKTGKKVLLTEKSYINTWYDSLQQQGKRTRDGKVATALAAMIYFQTISVVPEREYSKALNQLLNIHPTLEKIPEPSDNPGPGQIPYDLWKNYNQYFNGGYGLAPRISSRGNTKHFTQQIENWKKLKDAWTGKVKDLSFCDHNIAEISKYLPLCKEIDEISEKVKSAKEIKQQKAKEEIKGRTHPQIQKAVDQIADDFRILIEAHQLKFYQGTVKSWQEKADATGLSDPRKLFGDLHKLTSWQREGVSEQMSRMFEVLNHVEKGYAPKSEEELMKMANEVAQREADGFAFKMAEKLGGLLPTANVQFTVKRIYTKDSIDSNYLKFELNGGESSFYVQNQIVKAWSKLGRPFYRYPTTFHNLTVKGEKVKYADEVTVKKALNAAYG